MNKVHVLKTAILAIFQKSANWLDWPCPVSAALQNHPQDLCFSFKSSFSFIFLNMRPLSEAVPSILVIQIQIQAVWNKSFTRFHSIEGHVILPNGSVGQTLDYLQ